MPRRVRHRYLRRIQEGASKLRTDAYNNSRFAEHDMDSVSSSEASGNQDMQYDDGSNDVSMTAGQRANVLEAFDEQLPSSTDIADDSDSDDDDLIGVAADEPQNVQYDPEMIFLKAYMKIQRDHHPSRKLNAAIVNLAKMVAAGVAKPLSSRCAVENRIPTIMAPFVGDGVNYTFYCSNMFCANKGKKVS